MWKRLLQEQKKTTITSGKDAQLIRPKEAETREEASEGHLPAHARRKGKDGDQLAPKRRDSTRGEHTTPYLVKKRGVERKRRKIE